MEHVLEEINHTTLEALGFKWSGHATQHSPSSRALDTTDVFQFGAFKAILHSDGGQVLSIDDIPIQVSLDELKRAINTYKGVNTSAEFIALARSLVTK